MKYLKIAIIVLIGIILFPVNTYAKSNVKFTCYYELSQSFGGKNKDKFNAYKLEVYDNNKVKGVLYNTSTTDTNNESPENRGEFEKNECPKYGYFIDTNASLGGYHIILEYEYSKAEELYSDVMRWDTTNTYVSGSFNFTHADNINDTPLVETYETTLINHTDYLKNAVYNELKKVCFYDDKEGYYRPAHNITENNYYNQDTCAYTLNEITDRISSWNIELSKKINVGDIDANSTVVKDYYSVVSDFSGNIPTEFYEIEYEPKEKVNPKYSSDIDLGHDIEETCDGILGKDFINFLNDVFKWIKIIVPILVIVLGSVDFAGSLLQDDKDAMKKATSKFIKRLLVAVAIFLLTFILTFVLNIFNKITGAGTTVCEVGMINLIK